MESIRISDLVVESLNGMTAEEEAANVIAYEVRDNTLIVRCQDGSVHIRDIRQARSFTLSPRY